MTESTTRDRLKIVWGVDLFSENREAQDRCAEFLRALASVVACNVDPVQVVALHRFLPLEGSRDEMEVIRLGTKERLAQWLKQRPFPEMEPPTVLMSAEHSTRGQVAALLNHAARVGAHAVVVSTHARKGMPRFLLGSFAETLLLHSSLPVVVVNPAAEGPFLMGPLVFPHDGTQASDEAFESAMRLSQHLRAKIILFHRESFLPDPALSIINPLPAYSIYLEKDRNALKAHLESLVVTANARGIKTELRWDREHGPVETRLLLAADDVKAGLIVMASQANPAGLWLAGSVTRQVARAARCPVWSLPGKRGEASTKETTEALPTRRTIQLF